MTERSKSNTSTINFQIAYPGPEAYHFPVGVSHESPCMSSYFRSKEYLSQKEQWMKDAGIFNKTIINEEE
mgnify:CR=1 FL=1